MAAAKTTPGERALRVAFVWNGTLQDECLVATSDKVILGDSDDAIFPLPEGVVTESNLTLMNPADQGHELQLTDSIGGDVWVKGRRSQVRELKGLTDRVRLGPEDYGVLTVGTAAYFFQYVKRPAAIKTSRTVLDWGLLSCILLSVFLHATAGTLLILAQRDRGPDDPNELSRELMSRFMVTPPPVEPPPPPPEHEHEKVHEKKAEPSKVRPRPQPDHRDLPRVVRQRLDQVHDHEEVSTLTKMLQHTEGPTLSHVMSTTTFARGTPNGVMGIANALSTLPGGSVIGSSSGGGAITTIGGDHATAGIAALAARNHGPVRGRVSNIAALARTTGGGLSRAQILEVIGRYQGRIQQCYERALNHNPGLSGRMTFSWQVTASGSVSNATQRDSTLGDNGVSTCIIGVLRTMRFPRPTGGTVDVTFPFLFQRAQ